MARPQLKPGTHGSISYRPFESRIEASTYLRGWDGARLRMKASGASEAGARDALIAKITLHNAGLGGGRIGPDTTIAELGLIWLVRLEGKSAGTLESYGREVRRFITPGLGSVGLADASPAALEAFLAGRPGSAAMVSRVVLRAMFALAVSAGAVPSNPVPAGTVGKRSPGERRRLTRVEYARLLNRLTAWMEAETAGGSRNADLRDQVELLLGSGVKKVPEMLAADWADLDLASGRASWRVSGSVERSASRGLHVRRYAPGAARAVPLPGSVVLMLRRRRATIDMSRTGLVFESRAGGPVDPANWRRAFAAAAGEDFAWVRPGSLPPIPAS